MHDTMMVCAGDAVDVSAVPTEIRILPLGQVHSTHGDFLVDDESFRLINSQFLGRKLDLVIDYEHQTLKDVQAPAGGWIKALKKGSDAILAEVEWTPAAQKYLKNKEYRYLSPVVMVRNKDKRAVMLHSVALTNTPAIDGMFPIVNSIGAPGIPGWGGITEGPGTPQQKEGGTKMDLKELTKLFGLPETVTEEELKKAIQEAVKAAAEAKEAGKTKGTEGEGTRSTGEDAEMVANSTILSMLGLGAGAKTEDVAASIMALRAGNGNTEAELMALKAKIEEREAADAVEAALKAGKITAAQKDWAKAYALKDASGFQAFVAKAPVLVQAGKMDLKDAPDHRAEELDDLEMAICKNCGFTEEDVKKMKEDKKK